MGKSNMNKQPGKAAGTDQTEEKPTNEKQANEKYPMEDRVLKDAAWFLGEELFPLIGVKGKMKRAAPTEAVYLEIQDFLADFNYEMEDGTWSHLEFESDSISAEDLRRFHACESVLSYRYKVEVFTYVLCSSKVKALKDHLRQGFYTYRVKIIRMKDYNADKIIKGIEKKQKKNGLSRKDLLEVLLTPLMDGKMPQGERIQRGFEILQRERGNLSDRELAHMQSVLYALMTKFLKEDEIREKKEMIFMTLMGQLLMEEGVKRGRQQGEELGKFKTLQELIADGVLTVAEAAARKEMTEEEFRKKLRELQLT